MRNFSLSLKGRRAYMKTFPGAKFTQPNHYVHPTLDNFKYDVTIIPFESITLYNQKVEVT